ncbi:MAG: chemotaxis protein CheR, partial [Treponema sp.]|nr:chemotaxis protein CheR [Treponema sp.]
FLYHRVEQVFGIKTESEDIKKLNEYIEKGCGASFIENPAAFESMFTSREKVFEISRFVTTNETYFFREGAHFELLARLLPQLATLKRPIRVCSAATSIGCEAYSIAMLLDYHAKGGRYFDFEIDAFDISADEIETAKTARYTANTLRGDGSSWKYILDLYLIPDNGKYVVSENIRQKVRFFNHNIMRGLSSQYDVIFFRNALIYFTSRNRMIVINDLAESLFVDGILFLGITETSSVNHPMLASRYASDVFYFQKTSGVFFPSSLEGNQVVAAPVKKEHAIRAETQVRSDRDKPIMPKRTQPQKAELVIDYEKIMTILGTEEGQPNAKKTVEAFANTKNVAGSEADNIKDTSSLSGSELAASAVYFLNIQDFNSADLVLSQMEKYSTVTLTQFLRGDYHFFRGKAKDAENFYEVAAGKDKAFWPAFYRIATLAADGHRAKYEYKIKKAIESIELWKSIGPDKKLHYECCMGGFSADYFLRILERKLT